MGKELSVIIPTELSRLNSTGRVQKDTSTRKLLLELDILGPQSLNDLSDSRLIYGNLETLIANKDITMIPTLDHAKYLDDTYKAHAISKYFSDGNEEREKRF